MKLIVAIAIIFGASTSARSQQTPVWEYADTSSGLNYNSFNSSLAAATPADIASISETSTWPGYHYLRHSTDSGRTWRLLYQRPLVGGHTRWNAFAHRTAEQYVIAGDSELWFAYLNYNNYFLHKGFIIVSADSGATWKQIDLDTNTICLDVAMLSDSVGVAIVQNVTNYYDPLPQKPSDDLLITTDGWRTWTSHALPSGVFGCQQVFCFSRDSVGVRTVDRYYLTSDAGSSWQALGFIPSTTARVSFVNSHLGWGAVYGWFIETTDGGGHWATVRLDSSDASDQLTSVSFSDSLHGIAVGNQILRTSDGGVSWVRDDPPSTLLDGRNGDPHFASWRSSVIPSWRSEVIVSIEGPILRWGGEETLLAPHFHKQTDPSPVPIHPRTVSWTPIFGATHYRVQFATQLLSQETYDTSIFESPLLDTITADTTIILAGLKPATLYFGRIKALNANQESDWRESGEWYQPGSIFYTVTNPNAPMPPTIVSPPNNSHVGSSVRLNWTAVPGAVSYRLRFFLMPSSLWIDTTVSDTTLFVQGLILDAAYDIQVRGNVPNDTTDWEDGYILFTDGSSGVSSYARDDSGVVLTLFPDPASDRITLSLHYTQKDEAEDKAIPTIYDALGRQYLCPVVSNSLDISRLPAGVYYMSDGGSTNGAPHRARFVKE